MNTNQNYLLNLIDSIKPSKPSISDRIMDRINFASYSREQRLSIQIDIEELIGVSLSSKQFQRILEAWDFRNVLIELCNQVDFKMLRARLDKFIKLVELLEMEQTSLLENVNILFPVFNYAEIKTVLSVDSFELNRLKIVRNSLSRKKGTRGNEAYLTKCAYFELFFIGEALGLSPRLRLDYSQNDLITFAEIVTQSINPDRSHISEHHQKYANFKEQHPAITKCIEAAKSAINDEAIWLKLQEGFQTYVYANIPVPSSK